MAVNVLIPTYVFVVSDMPRRLFLAGLRIAEDRIWRERAFFLSSGRDFRPGKANWESRSPELWKKLVWDNRLKI